MINIKLFCNIKDGSPIFGASTKCEVISLQTERVRLKAKTKNGSEVIQWMARSSLENFRYRAWWNGIKAEYIVAKKLAQMATLMLTLTGQDMYLIGSFEIPEIKKLIAQIEPYTDYYEQKNRRD